MWLIDKIGTRLCYIYAQEKERQLRAKLGACGEGGNIEYPSAICHPELIEIGNNSVIKGHSRIQLYPELTQVWAKVKVGNDCLIGAGFCALAGEDITIGNNCAIASNVCIVSENHGINPTCELPYGDQKLRIAPVKIGDGCWIGEKATILPGVTIGEKSVIGAGAVVTKSVPSYSIAVGNPAKVIKEFDFEDSCWKEV